MEKTVELILQEWRTQGQLYFEQFKYPETFEELINRNPEYVSPYDLMTYARIALLLQNPRRAVTLAQNALNRLGWTLIQECNFR